MTKQSCLIQDLSVGNDGGGLVTFSKGGIKPTHVRDRARDAPH
jgi:hypothetical protein